MKLKHVNEPIRYFAPEVVRPAKKIMWENELTTSYVHPFIRGLFQLPNNNPHSSNQQPVDDFSSNEKRRPDYKMNVFHSSNIKFTNTFSEVKIKPTSENGAETSLIYFDLLSLDDFSKEDFIA
jgi:hypothetical protein